MSIKVMTLVWDHYPEGGSELLLALALADWANHDGSGIWPSVQTMADKTRQSERAVQYQLAAMKKIGWLEPVATGGGRTKTTMYRMPIERIPKAAEGRVQDLHPLPEEGADPKGCKIEQKRVQPSAKKGATAIAPDPSLTVKEPSTPSGQGTPSPVSQLWTIYTEGVKRLHNAEPPTSKRSNGMLAQVVARVGAEPAKAVMARFLAHPERWYGLQKHGLNWLVRDCEKIWIEVQQSSGGAGVKPPTSAVVSFVYEGGSERQLQDYPVGDHLMTAKQAVKDYSGMIAKSRPKSVAVRVGGERRTFTLDEVRA